MPSCREGGFQTLGVGVPDHVQVPRRRRRPAVGLGSATSSPRPGLLVVRGRRAATVGPAVEVGQLDAQDRRLQLVQARVVADLLVADLVARAVEAQHSRALGDLARRMS